MGTAEIPYTYFNRKKLKGGIKLYWRFRRDEIDTPLPGQPGDIKFAERYAELLAQAEGRAETEKRARQQADADRHTFRWLCESYKASAEFRLLAAKTQVDYAMTIDERLVPGLGPERFDCITRASVKLVRDKVAKKHSPRTANKVKQMVSRLYSWAEEEDLLPDSFINPGMKLKRLKGKTKHIEIWSDDEVDLFLEHCEPFMKTPVLLALYTGQRCEDLATMEWSAYHGGTVRVRQNKTGEPLDIACHKVLREHLDSIRTGFGGTIVRAASGRPFNGNALSSALYRAVAAVPEMPQRSMHGLRYLAAGKLEEAGCSVVQITSLIGHRTYQMAMQYLRQRRDAQDAVAMLEQSA